MRRPLFGARSPPAKSAGGARPAAARSEPASAARRSPGPPDQILSGVRSAKPTPPMETLPKTGLDPDPRSVVRAERHPVELARAFGRRGLEMRPALADLAAPVMGRGAPAPGFGQCPEMRLVELVFGVEPDAPDLALAVRTEREAQPGRRDDRPRQGRRPPGIARPGQAGLPGHHTFPNPAPRQRRAA